MSGAAIGFYLAAALASGAALAGVIDRRPGRSLLWFALVPAALVVPLIQVGAELVAAVELLAGLAGVGLLAGVLALPRGQGGVRRRGIAHAVLASIGLLAFVWVLLATVSRQVVEPGKPIDPNAAAERIGKLEQLLYGAYLVPLELVALIGLVALVAVVLARPSADEEGRACR